MADTFDENGLTIDSLEDLTTGLIGDMRIIYGNDINVNSDSPDGQLINIFCQMAIDLRELLQKINASFDPDQAEGKILDQRVAINHITRKGATYTYTDIDIVITKAVTLQGLDDQLSEAEPDNNPFTVKDDAGTKYYLVESQAITVAGTYSYSFRSADIGQVETTINTITIPDSIVAAVDSVNNPDSATIVGVNEESDFLLKRRRQQSTAISATGYVDSIEAALFDISEVTYARVYENDTDAVDEKGIAPNGIWCIIEGGSDDDIAGAIYSKRAAGTPMKGVTETTVLRANGGTEVMKYDRPTNQDLYIAFTCVLPDGVYDEDNMKELIVANVLFNVGQDAVGSRITCYVQELNEEYQITDMMVSDDGSNWYQVLSPTAANYKFVASVSRITIASS